MACKKCGKMKCACGGPVKKAEGGMMTFPGKGPAGGPPGLAGRPFPGKGKAMGQAKRPPMNTVGLKKGGMAKKGKKGC